jgi:hypothetical protein
VGGGKKIECVSALIWSCLDIQVITEDQIISMLVLHPVYRMTITYPAFNPPLNYYCIEYLTPVHAIDSQSFPIMTIFRDE